MSRCHYFCQCVELYRSYNRLLQFAREFATTKNSSCSLQVHQLHKWGKIYAIGGYLWAKYPPWMANICFRPFGQNFLFYGIAQKTLRTKDKIANIPWSIRSQFCAFNTHWTLPFTLWTHPMMPRGQAKGTSMDSLGTRPFALRGMVWNI